MSFFDSQYNSSVSARNLRSMEEIAAARSALMADDAARFGRDGQLAIQSSSNALMAGAPTTKLTARQARLLDQLSDSGQSVLVRRADVNLNDLSVLTKRTGHEFGMFTLGGRRMVFRGNPGNLGVAQDDIFRLASEGWRFSGHTHPGVTSTVLTASGGDRAALRLFNEMGTQKRSVVLNSEGMFRRFSSNVFDDMFGF